MIRIYAVFSKGVMENMPKRGKEKRTEEPQAKTTMAKAWAAKAACLCLAILIWVYVSYDETPTTDKTFSDIAVENISGVEALTARDLIILERNMRVTVKLSGTRGALAKINKADIKATMDVSGITQAGEQTPLVTISGIPDTLNVDEKRVTGRLVVDHLLTQEAAVDIRKTGTLSASLKEEEALVEPATVTLTGPASLLGGMTVCTEDINISDIKSSETVYMPRLVIKDADGNKVEGTAIKMTDSDRLISQAKVTIRCLGVKIVPLSEPDIVGSADGYDILLSEMEPQEVEVTGPVEAVQKIDKIPVSDVEAYDILQRNTMELSLILPEGVEVESDKVKVRYTVREKKPEEN